MKHYVFPSLCYIEYQTRLALCAPKQSFAHIPLTFHMALISYGNSEIGEQVRSNLCNLICLKHLLRSNISTIILLTYIFSQV